MFNKNDMVVVISECQSTGYIGKVKETYFNGSQLYATVSFDKRLPCGNQCQPYNVRSLRLVKEGEIMIEPQKCEMIDGYYIVEVKGSYQKKYSYKCRFDVNIGDKVVCEDEDYIQRVIGVYNSENAPYKYPTKEVVCVVDYSEIIARKEREKELQRVKSELDKKVRQIQSKIDYEFYASKDNEVAELLKQLNELKGE